MGTAKAESHVSSNLALVACAVVGTLALSVPATALLMHYFSDIVQVNGTMQRETISLDGQVAALQYDRNKNKVRPRQHHDVKKFSAHLIGRNPHHRESKEVLAWKYRHNENFDTQHLSMSLIIPRTGFYYVYYQVGFRGGHCQDGRSQLTLHSKVFHSHESYSEVPIILLEGMETVCGQGNSSQKWYTSINQGRLVQLQQHHQLFVRVSDPDLVDYDEGKTFFGFMMVS